jgi:hypothetical protein
LGQKPSGYARLALLLIAGIASNGVAGALLILGLVGILFLATNAWVCAAGFHYSTRRADS